MGRFTIRLTSLTLLKGHVHTCTSMVLPIRELSSFAISSIRSSSALTISPLSSAASMRLTTSSNALYRDSTILSWKSIFPDRSISNKSSAWWVIRLTASNPTIPEPPLSVWAARKTELSSSGSSPPILSIFWSMKARFSLASSKNCSSSASIVFPLECGFEQ